MVLQRPVWLSVALTRNEPKASQDDDDQRTKLCALSPSLLSASLIRSSVFNPSFCSFALPGSRSLISCCPVVTAAFAIFFSHWPAAALLRANTKSIPASSFCISLLWTLYTEHRQLTSCTPKKENQKRKALRRLSLQPQTGFDQLVLTFVRVSSSGDSGRSVYDHPRRVLPPRLTWIPDI